MIKVEVFSKKKNYVELNFPFAYMFGSYFQTYDIGALRSVEESFPCNLKCVDQCLLVLSRKKHILGKNLRADIVAFNF